MLRLLAAGSVVAFHFTFGNHAIELNPVKYPAAVTGVTRYGFLGVQTFFFISGIVILNSAASGSAQRFAISRAARLYPAYWACVTATFLVLSLAGTRTIGAIDYAVNLTMLQAFAFRPLVDAVYWTLEVELIFYGIIWLALVTGQMKRITVVLGAWLALAAITTAGQALGAPVPVRLVVATGYAAYFVVGASAALLARGDRRRSVMVLFACSGGLSLVRALYDARDNRAMYPGLNVTVAVAVVAVSMIVVVAVAFGVFARYGRPWMAVLGALTYPLYLLHDEISNVLFTRWQSLNRWVLLLVVTLVVGAASWAVHSLIEQPGGPRLRAGLNRLLGSHGRVAEAPRETVVAQGAHAVSDIGQ